MDRHLFLSKIQSQPWAMRPEAIDAFVARVLEFDFDVEEASPRLPKVDGSIGIVPIYGVLGHRRSSGFYADSYSEEISNGIASLASNSSVGAIVLDIDSPGGTVAGLSELATMVNSAKAVKPIYAVANPEAASAAYHVASQATRLFAAPSAEVGSIGVWAAHMDVSAALERQGVKISLISAGKYKTEGNPWEPLGDDARDEMQRSVDLHYEAFLKAVAKGRNTTPAAVRDTFGQGRMVEADRAKSLGMIDGIASLGDVVYSLAKSAKQQARMRASAALIRLTESQLSG